MTAKDVIPVTTVARTLVDLTDVLGRDRVLRAIREADFLRLLDLDDLDAAIQLAHGRRRLGVLHQALTHHTPGQIVRGELEHRFLELVREAGLPAPETNIKVKVRARRYEIDCFWRAQRVAVELDGRAAHARIMAFESDRRKDACTHCNRPAPAPLQLAPRGRRLITRAASGSPVASAGSRGCRACRHCRAS